MKLPRDFQPMKASPVVLEKLKYPVFGSAKIDGIRAVIRDGVVLSNKMKPIPSPYVQRVLGRLEHLDGELFIGQPNKPGLIQRSAAVMRKGPDDLIGLRFAVFDHIEQPAAPYIIRKVHAEGVLRNYNSADHVAFMLEQTELRDERDVLKYEAMRLREGYEGIMLRNLQGTYKFGRSTALEQYLLKLKRFEDTEGVIEGFEEEMHNTNEAETNELGRTKRSSAKAGLVGKGTLGAFVVRGLAEPFLGVKVNVGTGMTAEQRAEFWKNRTKLKGKIIKFQYFPVGVKEAPRHPVFLCFRDPKDM